MGGPTWEPAGGPRWSSTGSSSQNPASQEKNRTKGCSLIFCPWVPHRASGPSENDSGRKACPVECVETCGGPRCTKSRRRLSGASTRGG
eukprot:2309125-Pyramimonas_sp.AAC.1